MKLVGLEDQINVLEPETNAQTVMRSIIESKEEEAFFVLDVSELVRKHMEWKTKMPRVQPFFAMKCNGNLTVLKVLAALGAGFDCASKVEIDKVLSLGVDPSRIVFANPNKMMSHIRHAAAHQVDLTAFDNLCELHKMKSLFPSARLILRIRCDSEFSVVPLGNKFGADPETEAPQLLQVAHSLGLNVVGISFHVGSGSQDPLAFKRGISAARCLFDIGSELGFNMSILDIGGGFPGNKGTTIDEFADIINAAIDIYFPSLEGVDVIAEPGRFYVASAFTIATCIHSVRNTNPNGTEYYISDGVYGTFSCVFAEKFVPPPQPIMVSTNPVTNLQKSILWGPTCAPSDLITRSCLLPLLDAGDWLFFENMGAYSLCLSTHFNGLSVPKVYAVVSEALWRSLKSRQPLTEEDFTRDFKAVNIYDHYKG